MADPRANLRRMMVEAAENVTFAEQLGQDGGPIVLMNVFRFAPEDRQAVIEAWAHDSDFMNKQKGFVSAQLHEGHAGSAVAFNYAVWQTVADLRHAVTSSEFLGRIAHYPASVQASPHIFRPVSVDGVCGVNPLVPAV